MWCRSLGAICLVLLCTLVSLGSTTAWAQVPAAMAGARAEPLWPEGAPGALGSEAKDRPMLYMFLPPAEKAVGTAVCVCPGGGYGTLAMDHEGRQIAEWFNRLGVAAFVVDYRHRGKGYGHPAPLQDAQRAVRIVRARAAEFRVRPDRIGIMGFSAGGHLASTVITHFDGGDPTAADPIQRVSCRPDFAILCYPVIALAEPFTHRGSLRNLLGENPDPALVESLSSEKQVRADTPPTFLFHTDEDRGVPPENSVVFYLALRKAGVPAELHIFRVGRHGLGLAQGTPGTELWPQLAEAWLRGHGFLP